jgi:hypothetical protein
MMNFSEPNTSVQECQDASVYKHDYRVRITHTMGNLVMDKILPAGSKAHAALMVGMELITELLIEGAGDEISIHNIEDHLVVDVELLVD